MKRICSLILVTFLVSCGKIESTVTEFADTAQGMINLNSTFTIEEIQGVWVSESTFHYYDLSDVYKDSSQLPIETYSKINPAEINVILEKGQQECTDEALSEYVEIEVKNIMIFENKNYQQLGYAKLKNDQGEISKCVLKFGASNYTTLGSYAYLVDRNESIYIESTSDSSALYMGFTE